MTTAAAVPAAPHAPEPGRAEVTRLADQLERSFRGGAWHGPSVSEALEGVDAALARRPVVAGVHTIAELAGHVAFWIAEGQRRIEGTPSASYTAEQNFPPAGAANDAAWAATLAGLEQAHRRLHATVLALGDERLEQAVAGSDPTLRGLVLGIAQHNAYHAGQIVVLKKAAGIAS